MNGTITATKASERREQPDVSSQTGGTLSLKPPNLESKYRYRPLQSPSSIRLLKVAPAKQQKDEIYCQLLEVKSTEFGHKEGLQYEALSWCWGSQPKDRAIYVQEGNGTFFPFHVSQTLYTALQSIRLQNESKTFWIDALCINQEDNKEKSEQVAGMDEIYSRASKVRIWLGEADRDSTFAIKFIKNDLLNLWKFDQLYDDPDLTHNWNALTKLMQRPWFTRKWVIQEVALADVSIIQCGDDTILWRDFADAVSLLLEKEVVTWGVPGVLLSGNSFNVSESTRRFSDLGAAVLVRVINRLFYQEKTGEKIPLLCLDQLISSLSIFEASDPRDTVYALLSLARDAKRNTKEESPSKISGRYVPNSIMSRGDSQDIHHYPVNYEQHFYDVCEEFITFCIKTSEPSTALDILCRPWAPTASREVSDHKHVKKSGPTASLEGLMRCVKFQSEKDAHETAAETCPSWISTLDDASFEVYKHPITGPRIARKNAEPFVGVPRYPNNYNASGNQTFEAQSFKFENQGDYRSMFVSGFVLEGVSHLAEPARLGNMPSEWFEMGGWTDPNSEPPEELWRTLVADQGLRGGASPIIYARACKYSFEWALEKGVPGGTFDTGRVIDGRSNSIVSEFLTKVQSVIWNRRLFLSNTGRLGLAHENTQKGDLVCIIYGCSVPVVLRRVPKSTAQMQQERDRVRATKFHLEEASAKTIPTSSVLMNSESWAQSYWKLPPKQRFLLASRYICLSFIIVELLLWKPRLSVLLHRVPEINTWFTILIKAVLLLSLIVVVNNSLIISLMESGLAYCKERFWWKSPVYSADNVEGGNKSNVSDHYYEVVGACYLHGMMNGEAIVMKNKHDIPTEIFELR